MITGRPLTLGGASSAVPSIFGDGSDGDLVIASGEIVELEVISPYLSVVERNYNSITIESGGTLRCNANNAGLVLRCKGDCTINGMIDQSCKSGKPNPNNNFDYPDEIICGNGGNGGSVESNGGTSYGGTGMNGHKGGGGWSGGGAGGHNASGSPAKVGGNGGSVNGVTAETSIESLFVGGSTSCAAGQNGGGGSGYGENTAGGSGPGGTAQKSGTNSSAVSGGGAGTLGGGVVMIYCGGTLTINGEIHCSAGNGGNCQDVYYGVSNGGSGGGAGGGAIYLMYFSEYVNYGVLNVNAGNAGYTKKTVSCGTAGTVGSITVKQYADGMTK